MLKILKCPKSNIAVGRETVKFSLPSMFEALDFVEFQTDSIVCFLRRWGLKLAIVDYPNCINPINIPATLPIKDDVMLKGLTDAQWLRIAEEILNESRPTFLVSMTQHRNILVNSGACSLMGCTAEELLSRDLTPFWVPPGEVKPISYSVQLPPHLAEFHRLLSQQSELISHNFEGWKVTGDNSDAVWVRWNDDIRFVELDGNPYRLMRVNGFDEVRV
ncbi:hypothetical protein PCC9214_05486 (plasmid) [Planktothrix tepida]|uniref:PAS domain-containing protein n=1 Tax=Planktothrix tepida PCC 9214 TaxID=671072 RepID=A0A1J1LE68_9CYAN|nr:hypothetical protein [Planktothrix tepida]CAD5988988.1 hypothetical protein PCC9214_05486 [Planktothrix tepida]CUR30258.1 hypothetical protein PL9214100002 [Planktothrix tepida PCC 9214]